MIVVLTESAKDPISCGTGILEGEDNSKDVERHCLDSVVIIENFQDNGKALVLFSPRDDVAVCRMRFIGRIQVVLHIGSC